MNDTPERDLPDLERARAFLKWFGDGDFGFRIIDDGPEPKRNLKKHNLYGKLDDVAEVLARRNAEGFGIFFTVNELVGKSYSEKHVTSVRAVFLDLDEGGRDALDQVLLAPLPPHLVVESSPQRYHCYWLVDGLPLNQFKRVQKALIQRFGGDKNVNDLPRVMRLPGFFHRKGQPFQSCIYHTDARQRYTDLEILSEFSTIENDQDDSHPKSDFDADMLKDALTSVPADDYENYISVVRAVKLSAQAAGYPEDDAKELVREWAKTSSKYEEREFEKRWRDHKRRGGKVQRLGTVFKIAHDHGWRRPGTLKKEDFWAYMPSHNYIHALLYEHWPASSVNARVPKVKTRYGSVNASDWLDRNRAVDQMTWAPGEPQIIEGRFLAEGGWIDNENVRVFNLYRPPLILEGDPDQAGQWRELLERLYPEGHEHIARWLAQRVQYPGIKINHGIILGGDQGIGKDTLLVPVKSAVGYWNMREVSPHTLMEQFNDWRKSVILRVSEARDLGGSELSASNRYSLYEHVKILTASPPEVLRVNEKHLRQYAVVNVVGLIVTTNYVDGMYLPPDDRRFFVEWSDLTKDDFEEDYFPRIYAWYEGGGIGHVLAYLRAKDLSNFDPKAPPPWTRAKAAMVDAGLDPDLGAIGGALDKMRECGQSVDAITTSDLIAHGNDEELYELLTDRKNRRRVPKLMEKWGYVKVLNDGANDNKWRINGKRVPVYARRELSHKERLKAARMLQDYP